MTHEIRVVHLDEKKVPNRRLGRHVEHDQRSRNFAFTAKAWPTKSIRHQRRIPVFDQGDLGSCTGNAGWGCLGTDPFFDSVKADHLTFDELSALALYEAATHVDSIPGHYPPDDTGSSGTAIAKVLHKRGLIDSYQWSFSTVAGIAALAKRPIIIGVPWLAGFENPDSNGLVKATGADRGGHEFVCDELVVTTTDPAKRLSDNLVGATNSWSEDWGDKGRFYFSWGDFGKITGADGDVTIFVPKAA